MTMTKHGWKVWAFLGYLGLAVIFTWPTAAYMGTHMPGGAGDPLLSCWYLARDLDRFMSLDLGNFYDSNMFHPHINTAAYSEHFAGAALMMLPLQPLFSGNIVALYNATLMLGMAITALGMHLLVRALGGRHIAAVAAAMIFTFAPCRIGQLEHLHMMMAQWMPYSLLFFVQFIRTARWRDAIAFTLFFLLNALTAILHMIFLTCACLIVALVELIARRSLRGLVVPTLCMGVLVAAVLAVVYLPYVEVRSEMGLSRNMRDNLAYSAVPTAYLAPPSWQGNHLVARRWLQLDRYTYAEGALLQGFIAYAGTLTALLLLISRRIKVKSHHAWAALLVILGLLISFGPVIQVGSGHRNLLFEIFFQYFPGANGLRVPARFSILVLLGVALLAGETISWLQGAMKRTGNAMAALLVALICVESYAFPIGIEPAPCTPGQWPAVYQWMVKDAPPGPIMEVPFGRWNDPKYVFYSTFHKRPMINGYSSYFPPIVEKLCVTTDRLFDDEQLDLLEQLGVRLLVIHSDLLANDERKLLTQNVAALDTDRLAVIWSDEGTRVLELRKTMQPDAWPRQLSDKGLNCVLGAPSVVGTDARELNANMRVSGPWSNLIIRYLTVPMNRKLDCSISRGDKIVTQETVTIGDALGVKEDTFELTLPAALPAGDYDLRLTSDGALIAEHQLTVREDVCNAGDKGAPLKSQISVDTTAIEGPPGMDYLLKVCLTNTADALWVTRREQNETLLGWKLRQGNSTLKEGRVVLPHDLGPGDSIELTVPMKLPKELGTYQVELNPLVEHIAWFDSPAATISLTIKAPITAPAP